MLRKINLILMLAFSSVFLVGCNEEENTMEDGINVRIIEDFDVDGFDIPPYFHLQFGCWNWGGFRQVLNGLTGEVENIIEFSEYHRFGNWCFPQPIGDYYVIYVNLFNTQEPDVAQTIASEFFIFDQDFNLVEEFMFSVDDAIDIMMKIGFPLPQTIGQNETGEWLGYTVGLGGNNIYAYNFHTHEIFQVVYLNNAVTEGSFLMPNINKLAFILMHDFGERVEFGFIDLETHEVTMIHEAENIRLSHPNQLQPIAPTDEVWLVNLITGSEEHPEREALMIHPLTGEVRTFPIREDDFTWRGDESYFRWVSDASITLDGSWLLIQANEFSEELVEGWCGSNATSTVRLYDTQTTELIFEYLLIDEDTLSIGESLSSGASIIQLEENIYLIRQSIGTGITEESFEPTGIRFEYIVIEIMVHGDE